MKATSLPCLIAPALLLAFALLRPGVCAAAHTKAETTPPSEPPAAGPAETGEGGAYATPKGALRAYDAALPAGGLEAAIAPYYARDDNERRVARALAEADLATSRLQQQVKEKFGPGAVDVVLRAARNVTQQDLNEATAKVDGDRATVTWNAKRPAVPMVKVDGKWRVSVAGVLEDVGQGMNVDALEQTCREVARELGRTGEELAAGDYPNLNLLERAVQQRMFKVLGED